MAQKVITTYVDDVSGEVSEEIGTHTLLVDGAGVELDLTPDSYDRLMDALGPFLHADGARRVRVSTGRITTSGKRRPESSSGSQGTAQIRAWARENGYEVNDRGRVPAPIREAYENAH